MVKYPIKSQSIRDDAVDTVTACLSAFDGNLKLTGSKVPPSTIDAYQRKVKKNNHTLADKMVSVKVDLCTRRTRRFNGINLQAVADGNFRVITKAVNELHEPATAAGIRNNIVSCLTKLCVLEKQIYSLTTDNESNVLKVWELMRSDFALPENFPDQSDEDECDVTEASDSELWEDVITAEDGVITVKCAVHTLQLNEHDFFKANSSAKEAVSKVKKIDKKMYKQDIEELFQVQEQTSS